MAKKTTEQLALNDWNSWESNDNGRWDHDVIETACLAYMSQQTRVQTARLRNIDNSMSAIKHYFHELDRDGFRDLIRAKSSDTRRRHNKKVVDAVDCDYCNVPKHKACQNSYGRRNPHAQRLRAYEAGA